VFEFGRKMPCFYVHYFEHSLYEFGKCRESEHVTILVLPTIDSVYFL
jgi:hypothetical protein